MSDLFLSHSPRTLVHRANTGASVNLVRCCLFFSAIVSFTLLFFSCANQLPPSGGADDKIPPRIISIFPRPNTINFKGDKIILKFDEFVDRRSFQESFYISPNPRGEIEFNWSGKEVEVKFSNGLPKNKTYVITIGQSLKDVRGSNNLDSSLSFAFSTGNKIDKGNISGRVYSDNNYDKVKILSYLKSFSGDTINPQTREPDYITLVRSDGSYEISNLPEGEYRMFAIDDDDRNNTFDAEVDSIFVLSRDYELTVSNAEITNVNFTFAIPDLNKNNEGFLKLLLPDSANFIYSNITGDERNIPPDYKLYFRFRNNDLTKSDIISNMTLTDSVNNKTYKLIFNWINDSLLEVFSLEKFRFSAQMEIEINLKNTKKNYSFRRTFYIADENSFGSVSGKIISTKETGTEAFILIRNTDNKFINYSSRLKDSLEFRFDEVLEGNYVLFSFLDENGNGKFDRGNYFPYTPSEKFKVYDSELVVKGSWKVENIFIEY